MDKYSRGEMELHAAISATAAASYAIDCERTTLAILAVPTMVRAVAQTCCRKSTLMCVSANQAPQPQRFVVSDRLQLSDRCVKPAVEAAPGRRKWKDQFAHYTPQRETNNERLLTRHRFQIG